MKRRPIIYIPWVTLTFACLILGVHSLESGCPVRRVVTYNTALLDAPLPPNNVNDRCPRSVAIANELRRMNVDVVCLQEVWVGEDVESITKSLRDVYPFSFSKLHYKGYVPRQLDTPRPAPCGRAATAGFMLCLVTNLCLRSSLSTREQYMCSVRNCFNQYVRLSQKCVSCIVVTALTTLRETAAKCVGSTRPDTGVRDINEPGLLLLSKSPLYNKRYMDYHPTTIDFLERGFLEADSPDMGKLVCTHMTFDAPTYYEPGLTVSGQFNSYLQQGNSERYQLVKRFQNVSPLLIMGDFNAGDCFAPGIRHVLPQAFRYLANTFDVIPLDLCTICGPPNNPYVRRMMGSTGRDAVVDHIFYKGHVMSHVVRVFEPMDAVLYNGFPLSDHYGVMAFIERC